MIVSACFSVLSLAGAGFWYDRWHYWSNAYTNTGLAQYATNAHTSLVGMWVGIALGIALAGLSWKLALRRRSRRQS